jgi:sugar phosphate isomerase/epimerase
MIRLGLVSAILPELSLAEVLDVCARERLDSVELMCWPVGRADRRYADLTHIDVTSLAEDRAAKLKEEVARSGVAISALGYYPSRSRRSRDRRGSGKGRAATVPVESLTAQSTGGQSWQTGAADARNRQKIGKVAKWAGVEIAKLLKK